MRPFLYAVKNLWQRLPVLQVIALTVLLLVVKEQYPFSDFPMYSHLDKEADVLYLTDQTDRVLPMNRLFGSGTATQKKVFITELKAICNPKKRDTRDALPEERREAGEKLMEKIYPNFRHKNLAEVGGEVTGIRLYYKVFQMDDDGGISETKPQLVAEKTL